MISTRCALVLGLLAATAAAAADDFNKEDNPFIVNSEAFQRGHPDVRWRNLGIAKYQQKRYAEAVNRFRDAARYGDKPAQAMLAMMLWNGDGIEADRIQACAWIDVAAERGYKSFVATRDKFWAALNEEERVRALDLSKKLYAKYGDESAKKRLNLEMTREKIGLVGSHLGRPKGAIIYLPGPNGGLRAISDTVFYDPRYWSPEKYWSWQDHFWNLPRGQVDVGPVQPVDETPKDVR